MDSFTKANAQELRDMIKTNRSADPIQTLAQVALRAVDMFLEATIKEHENDAKSRSGKSR